MILYCTIPPTDAIGKAAITSAEIPEAMKAALFGTKTVNTFEVSDNNGRIPTLVAAASVNTIIRVGTDFSTNCRSHRIRILKRYRRCYRQFFIT